MKHFDPVVDIQVDNSKGPITCQRQRDGRRATRNENKDDEGSREFSPEFTRNIYWPNVCLRIRATTFRRAGWLALSLGGDIKDFRGTNVNTEWVLQSSANKADKVDTGDIEGRSNVDAIHCRIHRFIFWI